MRLRHVCICVLGLVAMAGLPGSAAADSATPLSAVRAACLQLIQAHCSGGPNINADCARELVLSDRLMTEVCLPRLDAGTSPPYFDVDVDLGADG